MFHCPLSISSLYWCQLRKHENILVLIFWYWHQKIQCQIVFMCSCGSWPTCSSCCRKIASSARLQQLYLHAAWLDWTYRISFGMLSVEWWPHWLGLGWGAWAPCDCLWGFGGGGGVTVLSQGPHMFTQGEKVPLSNQPFYPPKHG